MDNKHKTTTKSVKQLTETTSNIQGEITDVSAQLETTKGTLSQLHQIKGRTHSNLQASLLQLIVKLQCRGNVIMKRRIGSFMIHQSLNSLDKFTQSSCLHSDRVHVIFHESFSVFCSKILKSVGFIHIIQTTVSPITVSRI